MSELDRGIVIVAMAVLVIAAAGILGVYKSYWDRHRRD